MKISLGKFKNKEICTLKSKDAAAGYRPTTAKHRQVIFNILQHSSKLPDINLEDACVADLCCGSGALGLEALSLGAQQVVFVDSAPAHTKLLYKTVQQLAAEKQATILCRDVAKLPLAPYACNIIFIDPPYHDSIVTECLQQLAPQGWLANEHVIVLEIAKQQKLAILAEFAILAERISGKTKLLFLRRI